MRIKSLPVSWRKDRDKIGLFWRRLNRQVEVAGGANGRDSDLRRRIDLREAVCLDSRWLGHRLFASHRKWVLDRLKRLVNRDLLLADQ